MITIPPFILPAILTTRVDLMIPEFLAKQVL